jgi:hypothetical protein
MGIALCLFNEKPCMPLNRRYVAVVHRDRPMQLGPLQQSWLVNRNEQKKRTVGGIIIADAVKKKPMERSTLKVPALAPSTKRFIRSTSTPVVGCRSPGARAPRSTETERHSRHSSTPLPLLTWLWPLPPASTGGLRSNTPGLCARTRLWRTGNRARRAECCTWALDEHSIHDAEDLTGFNVDQQGVRAVAHPHIAVWWVN